MFFFNILRGAVGPFYDGDSLVPEREPVLEKKEQKLEKKNPCPFSLIKNESWGLEDD